MQLSLGRRYWWRGSRLTALMGFLLSRLIDQNPSGIDGLLNGGVHFSPGFLHEDISSRWIAHFDFADEPSGSAIGEIAIADQPNLNMRIVPVQTLLKRVGDFFRDVVFESF